MSVERGDLLGVSGDDLVEFYTSGRAGGTFATYSTAFRKVWEHSMEIRCSIFQWGEGEVSGLLVKAGRIGVSENMIKQMMAVINIVFEVMGRESPTKGQVVAQVKKCAVKMRAPTKKILRDRMRMEDIRKLIRELFRTPAELVPAGERRCLILQVFLFFGMKRFSDVSDVKVKDVKYLHSGDLEVFVKSSKTDQERRGSTFVMSGKSKGGICIPELVSWYTKSLNLGDEDFLFPRLRGSKNGAVAVGSKAVAYSTALADLKEVTRRLGMPNLTLHSSRIGGATEGIEAGVDRDKIRICGGWSSSAMDVYIKPVNSGIVFNDAVMGRF
jgi:hypothetical protein